MMENNLDAIVKNAIFESSNRSELWCNILSQYGCETVCEVGVWQGEFAEILLSNLPSIREYTFIDPWQNLAAWNKPANVSNHDFEKIREEAFSRVQGHIEKIRELRCTTREAAAKIADRSLAFVYLDGDHTLRGITIDMASMISKIRQGGIMGGDDFLPNIWQHGDSFSPTEVFPYALYFAEAHDLKIYTLPYFQFLISNCETGFEVVDYAMYAGLSPREIYSKPQSSKQPTEEPSRTVKLNLNQLTKIFRQVKAEHPAVADELKKLL